MYGIRWNRRFERLWNQPSWMWKIQYRWLLCYNRGGINQERNSQKWTHCSRDPYLQRFFNLQIRNLSSHRRNLKVITIFLVPDFNKDTILKLLVGEQVKQVSIIGSLRTHGEKVGELKVLVTLPQVYSIQYNRSNRPFYWKVCSLSYCRRFQNLR